MYALFYIRKKLNKTLNFYSLMLLSLTSLIPQNKALVLLDSAANALEDGEVVEMPDLAGNPAALMLQGRTRFAVAQKLVADIKVCGF